MRVARSPVWKPKIHKWFPLEESKNLEPRERILLKAKEKFAAHGYAKTAMHELAGELGMSKKTLYKFFPTKLKIAEAIIEHTFAEVNRRADAILASPLPAVEKLLRIIHMIVEHNHRFATKTMLASLSHHLPHLWRRIENFRRERMRKNIIAVIEQGCTEGTVRANFNREMFMHFLLGAIQEGLSPEILMHASYSMGEALRGLIDFFLNGVLTPEGRAQYETLSAAGLQSGVLETGSVAVQRRRTRKAK